jgi:hypothetical protein
MSGKNQHTVGAYYIPETALFHVGYRGGYKPVPDNEEHTT